MELRAAEAARGSAVPRPAMGPSRVSQPQRAVLVAEDAAFWDHEGIDLEQIRESMRVNWEQGRRSAAPARLPSSWRRIST